MVGAETQGVHYIGLVFFLFLSIHFWWNLGFSGVQLVAWLKLVCSSPRSVCSWFSCTAHLLTHSKSACAHSTCSMQSTSSIHFTSVSRCCLHAAAQLICDYLIFVVCRYLQYENKAVSLWRCSHTAPNESVWEDTVVTHPFTVLWCTPYLKRPGHRAH